jgi:predicted aspartyl protease
VALGAWRRQRREAAAAESCERLSGNIYGSAMGYIRIEKTMKCALSLLMLAATGFFASAAEAADVQDCRLERFSSLPMSTLSDGRITVPVAIDGHTAPFLVDTGGISATMSRQLANEIGKEPQPFRRGLIGVGGASLYSSIYADDFALGGMHGKNILVFIDERIRGGGMDGTLAPEMMHRFDVDFDFRQGTVNFFSQEHCPGKIVYWTKDGAIVIPMDVQPNGKIRIPVTVDGNRVMAELDTGSVTSFISMDLARRLGVTPDSKDLKLKLSYGFKDRFKEFDYPFKTLSLDGLTVNNPHITVMSDELLPSGLGYDLTLGISFLRQLHLYIAYKEEKLYITPADAN